MKSYLSIYIIATVMTILLAGSSPLFAELILPDPPSDVDEEVYYHGYINGLYSPLNQTIFEINDDDYRKSYIDGYMEGCRSVPGNTFEACDREVFNP